MGNVDPPHYISYIDYLISVCGLGFTISIYIPMFTISIEQDN